MIEIDFRAKTNNKFYPLYANQDRYLVLWGGGSSGKSRFTAQKIVARIISEKGHRFLCLRKVAKTLRESVFAELKSIIQSWGLTHLFKIPAGLSGELHMGCVNGNEILFAGLDDVEKLKSIVGITGIWIEEASEIDAEDFRQLDIRMRGESVNYKQIIITFNPVSITHWLKDELVDSGRPDMTTHHSTYRDNRFFDQKSKEVLEGFKRTDEYYYTVYCLGGWGVLGKTIFDAQKVTERISQLRGKKPLREGFFIFDYQGEKIIDSTIRWIDEAGGYIRIFEDVQQGRPYVIGGDTAGEGSDWFTGQVINNVTGIQAATLRHQFDEDLYAKQMYCLGRYYNGAILSIEANFSSYPVMELSRLGYNRQYVRKVEDTYTGKTLDKFGFKTTKLTRPTAIAGLVEIVREHCGLLNDILTLEEMLAFVRSEKGRAEAQEGKFDDLIMGLAIAYFSREQQTMTVRVPEPAKTEIQRDKEKLAKQMSRPRANRRFT